MSTQQPRLMRRIQGLMFKLPLMISCEAFEDFILDYLDGTLPSRQRFIFEMHMKLCRECREYLDAYRTSLELVKSTTREEPPMQQVPEDLIAAVLAARKG